jgi:hypothetical protein
MRYVKDTTKGRMMVKIVKLDTNDIILQIPVTILEIHDFFKGDYITSILKNTFGEKANSIGNVLVVVDQIFISND